MWIGYFFLSCGVTQWFGACFSSLVVSFCMCCEEFLFCKGASSSCVIGSFSVFSVMSFSMSHLARRIAIGDISVFSSCSMAATSRLAFSMCGWPVVPALPRYSLFLGSCAGSCQAGLLEVRSHPEEEPDRPLFHECYRALYIVYFFGKCRNSCLVVLFFSSSISSLFVITAVAKACNHVVLECFLLGSEYV